MSSYHDIGFNIFFPSRLEVLLFELVWPLPAFRIDAVPARLGVAGENSFNKRRNVYIAATRFAPPNSPDCHIAVDGEKYFGEHRDALILFRDIERSSSNPVLRWVNRTLGRGMIRAAATQNVTGEHVGLLNHIFSYLHELRAVGQRIKKWNQPVYYALEWALLAPLCYAIIVGF